MLRHKTSTNQKSPQQPLHLFMCSYPRADRLKIEVVRSSACLHGDGRLLLLAPYYYCCAVISVAGPGSLFHMAAASQNVKCMKGRTNTGQKEAMKVVWIQFR